MSEHPPVERPGDSADGRLPLGGELVKEELDAVRSELIKADVKASTLLAVSGVGIALGAELHFQDPPAGWLMGAAMAAAVLAAIEALLVVRPMLGTTGFVSHARHTTEELRAELSTADPELWRSLELQVLSRLALSKYRRLRTIVGLMTGSLLLALAALLVDLM